MDLNKAYQLLETDPSISDDDLKAKFKKLAFKYHPDRNKTEPDKLKSINEAYQTITDYRANPQKHNPFGGSQGFGINLGDIFSGSFFNQDQIKQVQHINLSVDISFKESILGCNREIKYNRAIKCGDCNGKGEKNEGNGCANCKGSGRVVMQKGNVAFASACSKCFGRNMKVITCKMCNGAGEKQEETIGSISIPSGLSDADTLCMKGRGNYASETVFGDNYSDVLVKVNVEKDDELTLIGKDVVSNLKLSLLEALIGCEKEVKTINGKQSILVPPMAKNKEEIILKGLGVKSTSGNQRVIFDIDYPNKDITDKIIEILKEIK